MLLQTTLSLAAAAAVINFWLSVRIGQLRQTQGISVGDGGNDVIVRRMRAQLNFVENAPLFLILVGLVEMTGKGGTWLAPVGAVFMLGRVAHAFGMEENGPKWGRPAGALTAMLGLLGLAVVAVLIALGVM
ncbi:MAG: MAPEG family protein [Sphingomonadales bacterium]|nr:MAPEG family protein [Sphingomonadales bacterium]MBU3991321.1 MAPEG family protein [Alphaproteobacteria bacterium]